MNIYSPSQIILSLLGFAAIYIGYQNFFYDAGTYNYILVLLAIGLAIYFMRAELDYKFHQANPRALDEPVLKWLNLKNDFYNTLDESNQKKYRERLSLYLEARMFKGVGKEKKNAPEDIKVLISSHAIEMTMAHEDILIGDFDRIFLYNHPFGSPKKQFLHIVETEAEDGVIILCTPYVINAIHHPSQYYNIAYHAYGEAILKQNPQWDFRALDETTWKDVERVCGFEKKKLLTTLGYEQMDIIPVLLTLYYSHKEKFAQELPKAKKVFDRYFAF